LGIRSQKTANILSASSLAEKLKSKGVLAFSLNPRCKPSFSLSLSLSLRKLVLTRTISIVITDIKFQTNVAPEMFAGGYKITRRSAKP
jgi:hypothetical protein